jgi:hypothetical protein
MPAQHVTTDSRSVAPWAGTHADLKVVDGILSSCFKDIRQREQSEWEAANPVCEEPKADATKLEKISAEHLRLMREIRRLTKNDRFTGYCCFEVANRPIEVRDTFKEVLPSLSDGRIDCIQVRRRYSRDDIWMNASVHFGSKRVGILVEGTSPSWVESAANLLEKNLRARRPHWAPLVSGWGYWLSQVAFGGLVAAIVWRLTDGLGRALSWWGLVAAVVISFLAAGNPKFMTWLLPGVDIYAPASAAAGTTHLKWAGVGIAAATLGVAVDILLRG